ncbi:hypothetical protein GGR54DRAFT_634186 [Hypoxylon sp. NC1633]|nr:hypothetical protein GGR54DRAFT_634186 [Hypoxylon sp. NC1633]
MPLQIPHPNTPIHLYRHILREATYLPPLCQPWITSRIQARFRDCRRKQDAKFYVKEAHHYLRHLRSANAGHVKRMLRLCFLATGRVGKRRRLLGRSELSSCPPANSDELDEKTKVGDRDTANGKQRKPDWLDNWSVDKVKAIAFSQSDHQANHWPHHMRRIIDPARALPTENCFGRPLNQKLRRNKLKKHWVGVLRQLLPPLPRGEWDQLGTLTRGDAGAQHYRIPTRRPVAQSSSPCTDARERAWTDFVTRSVRSLERKSSRKMKSLSGSEDEDPRGHGRPIGVRVLGRRRLRRSIYGRVWEACPVVVKNPQSGKWNVKWGNQERTVSRPRKKDMQFFQGVDEKGVPTQSATAAATY